jgi:hypothetical protein
MPSLPAVQAKFVGERAAGAANRRRVNFLVTAFLLHQAAMLLRQRLIGEFGEVHLPASRLVDARERAAIFSMPKPGRNTFSLPATAAAQWASTVAVETV